MGFADAFLALVVVICLPEVKFLLKVQPKIGRVAKHGGQHDGCFGRQSPLVIADFVDDAWSYAHLTGKR